MPHCVFSALTALGEVQEGEVNIVRRGGASLGGQPSHASHQRGPRQLSPSRMLGPGRHLKKPGSRVCPSSPQYHLPLRGLNRPALTPKPQGSHPPQPLCHLSSPPGLAKAHAGVAAELEDMVLQTGLQAVGGGATTAHTLTVAARPCSTLLPQLAGEVSNSATPSNSFLSG